ncbi:MAG: putative Zn-dependent hydrolase of the beta-lactamase fold-like protein [Promethearchaeota archaeon]|nr:MAG: putative Zn-dependent hydrolase of the beta-lactamase fold-like protein [Candidatus Lokiarchaeota archaeon]
MPVVRFLGGACVEIIGEEEHLIFDPNYEKAPRKGIGRIFLTHEHSDHVDAEKMEKIKQEYLRQDKQYQIYGPKSTEKTIESTPNIVKGGMRININNGKVEIYEIDCWKAEDCLGYLITIDGKTILHTADSANYSQELMDLNEQVDICFTACFEDFFEDYLKFVKKIKPNLTIPYHFNSGDEEMAKELVKFYKENGVKAKYYEIGSEFEL